MEESPLWALTAPCLWIWLAQGFSSWVMALPQPFLQFGVQARRPGMCLAGWVVPGSGGRLPQGACCLHLQRSWICPRCSLSWCLVGRSWQLTPPWLHHYEPDGRGVPLAHSSSMSLCCCFRPACLSLETALSGRRWNRWDSPYGRVALTWEVKQRM